MSISTGDSGGSRRSTAIKPGDKPADGSRSRSGSAKPTDGSRSTSGSRPGSKGTGKRPAALVKVVQPRPWGAIAVFTVVALIAVGIVGFAGWLVWDKLRSVESRASGISGVENYRTTDKSLSTPAQHKYGPLPYAQSPPVGGTHNFDWQNCQGDVYDEAIANEHAVHSMEHGAVWVTYNPDKVSKADVDKLASKVRGVDHMLMSPYPGLDKPISLQAWGFQLKLDSASDPRIDDFIKAMRNNAALEKGGTCAGGITATGTTPHDLKNEQPTMNQPTA